MDKKHMFWIKVGPIAAISGTTVASLVYITLTSSSKITINFVDSGVKIFGIISGGVVTFFLGSVTGEITKVIISQNSDFMKSILETTSTFGAAGTSILAGAVTVLVVTLLEHAGKKTIKAIMDRKKVPEQDVIEVEHDLKETDDFLEVVYRDAEVFDLMDV